MKFWTQVYYEIEKLSVEKGVFPDSQIGTIQQRDFATLLSLRGEATRAYWAIITIRPKHGCEAAVLRQCTEKVVEKNYLKGKCAWVFEQKGKNESELGNGMHSHILFRLEGVKHSKRQKTKGQVAAEVYDTVNRIMEHNISQDISDCSIEPQCIDVTVGKKCDLKNAINYLTGTKASTEKHAAQKMDKIWRENEGFTSLYGTLDNM